MKKGFVCVLAALMLFTFTACDLFEKNYTVGICQFNGSMAMQNAVEGFQEALTEKLGERVTFHVENANGDGETCKSIVDGFVSQKVDMILACGTPALQAAAAHSETVPVIGTAVTDYPSALGLSNWNGTVGGNITGASDLVPPDQQADMILEMFPYAQTVGLLYCSQESDSQYQAEVLSACLEDLGITGIFFPFTDESDLASAAQQACEESDVLFVPICNCVYENNRVIEDTILSAGVPVVTQNAELCEFFGTVTLAIGYRVLSRQAGLMAAQILTGEKAPSSMPVVYATETFKLFNPDNCAALGVTIPEGYAPLG